MAESLGVACFEALAQGLKFKALDVEIGPHFRNPKANFEEEKFLMQSDLNEAWLEEYFYEFWIHADAQRAQIFLDWFNNYLIINGKNPTQSLKPWIYPELKARMELKIDRKYLVTPLLNMMKEEGLELSQGGREGGESYFYNKAQKAFFYVRDYYGEDKYEKELSNEEMRQFIQNQMHEPRDFWGGRRSIPFYYTGMAGKYVDLWLKRVAKFPTLRSWYFHRMNAHNLK